MQHAFDRVSPPSIDSPRQKNRTSQDSAADQFQTAKKSPYTLKKLKKKEILVYIKKNKRGNSDEIVTSREELVQRKIVKQ